MIVQVAEAVNICSRCHDFAKEKQTNVRTILRFWPNGCFGFSISVDKSEVTFVVI